MITPNAADAYSNAASHSLQTPEQQAEWATHEKGLLARKGSSAQQVNRTAISVISAPPDEPSMKIFGQLPIELRSIIASYEIECVETDLSQIPPQKVRDALVHLKQQQVETDIAQLRFTTSDDECKKIKKKIATNLTVLQLALGSGRKLNGEQACKDWNISLLKPGESLLCDRWRHFLSSLADADQKAQVASQGVNIQGKLIEPAFYVDLRHLLEGFLADRQIQKSFDDNLLLFAHKLKAHQCITGLPELIEGKGFALPNWWSNGKIVAEKVKLVRTWFAQAHPEWSNITHINLQGYSNPKSCLTQLSWEMIAILKRMDNLKVLGFSTNKLTTLPAAIGNLTQLEVLNLDKNLLKALPDAIDRLIRLKCINLDENYLTTLPNAIGNLTQLEWLGLGLNKFKTMPDAIAKLTQLKGLTLHDNGLTALPEVIGTLTKLEDLTLWRNPLTILPAWLTTLASFGKMIREGDNGQRFYQDIPIEHQQRVLRD